jgi:Icc-related predicted phosphoesterase
MKLLLISDLHYALKQYDWALRVAPEFDVVILAGDLLDNASHVDGRAQIVVVLKYLQRLSAVTTLLTCSGNHDLDAHNGDGEKTAKWLGQLRSMGIATDGDSVQTDDMLFTLCPWWDGPASRAMVGRQLARDAERRKGKWAWVYHAPPTGSVTSWNGRRSYGDEALSQWIGEYRPDFVFSGHVHTAPFCDGGSWIDQIGSTWVFNPGYQIGPAPACVVVDTVEQAVLWFATGRREYADLAVPSAKPAANGELPAWFKVSDQTLDPAPG